VNKFQIESKVQILKILNLEFDIHLIFACLPCLPPACRQAEQAGILTFEIENLVDGGVR
jgi:hypothetical protein